MDKDGYPEDAELETIKTWDWHDIEGLIAYVEKRWTYKNFFQRRGGHFTFDLSNIPTTNKKV